MWRLHAAHSLQKVRVSETNIQNNPLTTPDFVFSTTMARNSFFFYVMEQDLFSRNDQCTETRQRESTRRPQHSPTSHQLVVWVWCFPWVFCRITVLNYSRGYGCVPSSWFRSSLRKKKLQQHDVKHRQRLRYWDVTNLAPCQKKNLSMPVAPVA